MNETMQARREALEGLRDHFKRELTLALERHRTIQRFPRSRDMIRPGHLLIREHEVSVHVHNTSLLVAGDRVPRRIAQLDWQYRMGRMKLRLVAGLHVIEKYLGAEAQRKLRPTKFTREGFCSKLVGEDESGLDAEGLSLAAELIACLLENKAAT